LGVVLWSLIGLACALQAYEIPNRGIDPDELEHLHAAWCVSRGDVPYRDFFEHHGPALYYLLLPLFKLCGPRLAVLWLGRLAMWTCGLATLMLIGGLVRRWAGGAAGLVAMSLLAWTTVFHSKAIELRPDVPAMLLLMLAVCRFTYASGGGSWRRFLHVGLLAGLATLFTQKSTVPAAGIALAACLDRIVTRDPKEESPATVVARVAIPITAGIAAVWGTAGLLFSLAAAWREFWYSTWCQLWLWPVPSRPWENLRPTLAGDLTLWVAAASEIAALLKNVRAPETWKEQRGVAAIVAAVCIVSLAFVKASYPQFYLLWMPLLAALAAARIVAWCRRPAAGWRLSVAVGAGLLTCLAEILLCERAFVLADRGSLPHLARVVPLIAPLSIGTALVLGLAAFASARRNWTAFVSFLAGLGMGYGALRNVDRALWSNGDQVAAIDAVNRQVPTDGRVLDGYTGYAALRPHAWYYWWINEYSLALVPEEEREVRLPALLKESPPAAVLFDTNVNLLPGSVQEWIRDHYEPAEPPPLWLPRRRSSSRLEPD
ncbi:MAG: ArnT family glycosyltransferase, partial [Deltaproteobacteria bacterium]